MTCSKYCVMNLNINFKELFILIKFDKFSVTFDCNSFRYTILKYNEILILLVNKDNCARLHR